MSSNQPSSCLELVLPVVLIIMSVVLASFGIKRAGCGRLPIMSVLTDAELGLFLTHTTGANEVMLCSSVTGEIKKLPGEWRLHWSGSSAWLLDVATSTSQWARDVLDFCCGRTAAGAIFMKNKRDGKSQWRHKLLKDYSVKYATLVVDAAKHLFLKLKVLELALMLDLQRYYFLPRDFQDLGETMLH